MTVTPRTSPAFIAASWVALFLGSLSYLVGLWNAEMVLNEKGYYLTLLLFGLYSAVSLQKIVRDKLEGIQVTAIFYGLSWFALGSALLLLGIGLFNAQLLASEKGFYAMSYALSLFGAVAVQKNIRDTLAYDAQNPGTTPPTLPIFRRDKNSE